MFEKARDAVDQPFN